MDQSRKKTIKQAVALVCAAAVVSLLAAMPLLAKQDAASEGPQASILSAEVAAGSIRTELYGGGALAEEDAVTVSVPAEVKLTAFLVSNGDAVTEGTPIASVDRVTVMTAISQVQETLEYLSEQIGEAADSKTTENVTALAGGTVKAVYARPGDSVRDVMLEHGALAVLSLDGLMAVDLETESGLPAGRTVTVIFSDGTAAEGRIVKNLVGEMTVTLEDDDYAIGEEVTVTDEAGDPVGTGALYVYSPWNATAYAGTVSSIEVSEGDTLRAGRTLMVLEEVGYSATYRQLVAQRQEYEELMLDLFKMYQTETVTAPCDGVVSGIDRDSLQLLSDSGKGFVLSLLSNAPAGDPDATYTNFVGQLTGISSGVWSLNINPSPFQVEDYRNPGVSLNTDTMTQAVTLAPGGMQVYVRSGDDWVSTGVSVGDILLFAADSSGGFVWCVKLGSAALPDTPETEPPETEPPETEPPETEPPETEPPETEPPETEPPETEPPETEPPETEPPETESPETEPPETEPPATEPGNSSKPGGAVTPGFTYPSGGNGMGGMMQQESVFELYGLEMADIAAVTPRSTVTLDISVDELDIRHLYPGMTAQVKLDALGSEKYTAVVTEIGNTGTNSGGSSKYTVELTLDRTEDMLSGMNATAVIVLAEANDVLTVPAAALVEQGNQTVVYTAYDEETETLTDPVPVKTGRSDGENVEILEGLEPGRTVYYAYYDTLEISFVPDFGGGLFG